MTVFPKAGGVDGCRRAARAVERVLSAGRRVPDQPEGIAADPAALRRNDGQRPRSWRSPRRPPSHPGEGRRGRPRSPGDAVRRPRRASRAPAGPGPTGGRRSRGVGSDRTGTTPSSSSSRRSWASGSSANPSSTAVAMSIPSIPRASAANPPIKAPMIWPTARKTEYRPMIAPRSCGKRSEMSASRPRAAGVAPAITNSPNRGHDRGDDRHDDRQVRPVVDDHRRHRPAPPRPGSRTG